MKQRDEKIGKHRHAVSYFKKSRHKFPGTQSTVYDGS